MGLAPLGVLDLSQVTNTLISMLENYIATQSPLWQSLLAGHNTFPLSYSGALPDAVRKLHAAFELGENGIQPDEGPR